MHPNAGKDTPFITAPVLQTRNAVHDLVFRLKPAGQTALGKRRLIDMLSPQPTSHRSGLAACDRHGNTRVELKSHCMHGWAE